MESATKTLCDARLSVETWKESFKSITECSTVAASTSASIISMFWPWCRVHPNGCAGVHSEGGWRWRLCFGHSHGSPNRSHRFCRHGEPCNCSNCRFMNHKDYKRLVNYKGFQKFFEALGIIGQWLPRNEKTIMQKLTGTSCSHFWLGKGKSLLKGRVEEPEVAQKLDSLLFPAAFVKIRWHETTWGDPFSCTAPRVATLCTFGLGEIEIN